MRFGRTVDEGFLPVFSVENDSQAKSLIVATCPMDNDGNYYSRELAGGQTLENLRAFSDKLADVAERMKKAGG